MTNKKRHWTKEELTILCKEYPTMNINKLSKKLDRSVGSIYRYAQKSNVKRRSIIKRKRQDIKTLYKKGNSYREICKILDIKSMTTVGRNLKKMGIRIRSNSEGVNLTYKHGRTSWSKGLSKDNSDILKLAGQKTSKSKTGVKIKPFTKEHKEKIGLANKGKIQSDAVKKHLSIVMTGRKCPKQSIMMKLNNPMKKEECKEKMRGKNSPAWRGGTSFEPYDPRFNNQFKQAIRKRDNQICMLCKIHREKLKGALSVHHINYNKKLTIPENCLSLCKSCHSKTNHNRKHWTKFLQSILSERYDYNYSETLEPIIDLNLIGENNAIN